MDDDRRLPSDALLATLRAWRRADAVPEFVRIAVGNDALYIGGTIGAWWFLTADGRVLEYPDEEAGAVVRERRGAEATWILAECAWLVGVAELLDLLPAAPEASTMCSACRGSHYVSMQGVDKTVACYACHGLGWCPVLRFALGDELLAKLRAHRDTRPIDEVERQHDAFLVDPGMGPMTYLTSDGRVLADMRTADGDAVVEVGEEHAVKAIVCGAKKTGVSELLALVPPAPAGAITCDFCGGTRWWDRLVCPKCCGRGWRVP